MPAEIIPTPTVELQRNQAVTSVELPRNASGVPTPSEMLNSFNEEDDMIPPSEMIILKLYE